MWRWVQNRPATAPPANALFQRAALFQTGSMQVRLSSAGGIALRSLVPGTPANPPSLRRLKCSISLYSIAKAAVSVMTELTKNGSSSAWCLLM